MRIKYCLLENVRLSEWKTHRLADALPENQRRFLSVAPYTAAYNDMPLHFVQQQEGRPGSPGAQAVRLCVKEICEQADAVVSTVVFFNIQRTAVYVVVAIGKETMEAYEAFLQAGFNLGYQGALAVTVGPLEELSVPNVYLLSEDCFATGPVSTLLTYKYYYKDTVYSLTCEVLCVPRNPFLTLFPFCRWRVDDTHVATMLKMEASADVQEDMMVHMDGVADDLRHVLHAAFEEFWKLRSGDGPSLLAYARNYVSVFTEAEYRGHTFAVL
jgi:hypothetical protein